MRLSLLAAAATLVSSASASTCEVHVGKNNNGNNLKKADGVSNADDCCGACQTTVGCIGYTWVKTYSECWLKDRLDSLVDDDDVISGSVGGPSPAPTPTPTPTPTPSPSPSGQPRLIKGWNLGNTLEGGGQPREEWIFESVKSKGFDWVRIPVKWDGDADDDGNVDTGFMAIVEETVGWANKHGLVAKVNTHHEDWFDNGGSLDRLVNIWRQIAQRFKGYANDKLVFEIFNEPNKMSLDTLNRMNAAVLAAIRESNPTRLVFLGGLAQMGRWWINTHPDAMSIPSDNNLGLTVHSYDPWNFAGDHPSSQTFSSDDEQEAHDQMSKLKVWAQQRGIKQVVMNEFGVTNDQPNKEARLRYYRVNSQACISNGHGYAIWDDNGWWQVLNRGSRSWQEDVLSQLASPQELLV